MTPSYRKQLIRVLVLKQRFLVRRVTRIRSALLRWYDERRDKVRIILEYARQDATRFQVFFSIPFCQFQKCRA